MTVSPQVELRFNPTDLRPRDLPTAGAFLGSPADALEAALAVTRVAMVEEMRKQVRGIESPTHAQLVRIADLAWQAAFWRFRKISAPVMADAYLHAYQAADAGDVPMHVIYDLADKHAEKVGDYFHETSREALAEGFNTLVNRRIPAKAAADRVLDAYGLTPRQMRAYTAAQMFDTPVSDVMPRSIKAKARAYIDRAFTTRTRKLSEQEEHNIDEQAKQFAWMWMKDKGRLNEKAEKLWITAKDEKVCPVCGPLHGQRVKVNERFVTAQGEFWTPGLHPNCRCEIRLLEHTFSKDLSGGVLAEFNREHPRGDAGRFSAKARTRPQTLPKTQTIDVDQAFREIVAQPVRQPVRHLTYTSAEPAQDTELDQQFAELIAAQPKQKLGFKSWSSTERKAFIDQVQAVEPQLDFAADLAVHLRAEARTFTETRPQQQGFKTPVQHVKPAFAVIGAHQLEDGDISQGLRLRHGNDFVFTTDGISAAADATELIQREREKAVLRMLDHEDGVIEETDHTTGQKYFAEIQPDEAKSVADWYANNATKHWHEEYDPDFIGDTYVSMEWYDEKGRNVTAETKGTDWLPDYVPYSYIGEKMGLDQNDFEVYVVELDAVPTEEGSVEHISGGPRSRHQSFTVDADYDYVPESVSKVVHDEFGVTTYKIEPRGSVVRDEGE